MNISNYYWYFESAVPPRICDLIVKYGKSEKEREIMAITGGFGRDRNLTKQPLTKDEIKDPLNLNLSLKYLTPNSKLKADSGFKSLLPKVVLSL